MNQAEQLLRRMFRWDGASTGDQDVFPAGDEGEDPSAFFHPDCVHSLFGPSGTKETLVGRDTFLAFAAGCAAALSDRTDEVLAITGIDEQCALVHARAFRESKATGEQARYEWAMLYRVEDGRITYGADMLDADAQAFWGRIHGNA
jgi:ketosteroid isomerase-like protein